ncbi:MAG: RNA polymerase sigma factor [Chloroflexi bacterium]|nr:RNA polymerase sigma factor [Chloroflexota bacterium]
MDTESPDGALVACVCQGDLDALGVLYERYKSLVHRTALAITGDPDVADDILQEVFLRLYRYADTVDQTVDLGPWLYRVTTRLTYTWIRRMQCWAGRFQEILDRWALVPGIRSGPERAVEQSEQWRVLLAAIDALPTVQRVVVVLHYLENLSTQEIAEILEAPEGTVKSRLYYARAKLREAMLSQGYGPTIEIAYEFT